MFSVERVVNPPKQSNIQIASHAQVFLYSIIMITRLDRPWVDTKDIIMASQVDTYYS